MSSLTPSKVTPLLMFTGCAGEALKLYRDLLEDAAFDVTPSLSLFVSCDPEEEIERLFTGLSDGGFVMMPLSTESGFAARYAWLSDRFGVSWQLSPTLDVGASS